MKSKQKLIEEAANLGKLHQQKKEAIEKILYDLDREEKTSSKHLIGIATINEILKEMNDLEDEHKKILEQIKQS